MDLPKDFISRKAAFRLNSKPSVSLFVGARSAGISQMKVGWHQPLKTPDYLELFWCESGTFQFPLLQEDRMVFLNPGEVFFLFPGDLHGQVVRTKTAKYCWVTFDGHVQELVHDYQLPRAPFPAGSPPEELFLRLIGELLHLSPTMQYHASTTALEILHNALAAKDGHDETLSVTEFCKMLEYQFASPECTVESLADQLNISRVTLFRMVKMTFGCSPKEYLIRYRIREAMKLLLGTTIPVSEIAERCGFSYANYFSRTFRSKMNCTPEEFRHFGENVTAVQ